MKTLVQILGSLIFVAIVLIAFSVGYSTYRGYMTWYFRVNGEVTVDGHKTSGYMHANVQKTILLLTRTDGSRPETYLVRLGSEKFILDCGKWHPVRFLPAMIGDVNPPCLATDPKEIADAPVSATLVRKRSSLEFSTASDKKIRAEF